MRGAVSRRYARALFSLARDAGALESTAEELERLAGVASNPQIGPVLRSPLLSPSRRKALAETLIADLAMSDLVARFVRLLADRQRLAELPAIAQFFLRLLDDEKGRVRLALRTAVGLDDADRQRLTAAFARLTGKEIIPAVTVEPGLLGGVVAEVEGKVYDGSVRSQLERIAKQLAGGARL